MNQSFADDKFSKATLAAGCFWCIQADFDKVNGVIQTTVGYTGGETRNPTYEQVSKGETNHAEAIEIIFDPNKISYGQILDIFWKNIDPYAKDKQFCDVGKQYRSAIFYHNENQKNLAIESKISIEKIFKEEIIFTEITKASDFYPAESYHQEYYKKNPLRYKFYRSTCGRDKRLKQLWNNK